MNKPKITTAASATRYAVESGILLAAARSALALGIPAGELARLAAKVATGERIKGRTGSMTVVTKRELDALEVAFDALIDPAHYVEAVYRSIEEGGGIVLADKPNPMPEEEPAAVNRAAERQELLAAGITYKGLRSHYRAEFERARVRRPNHVATGFDGRGNDPVIARSFTVDIGWTWAFNRHLIVSARESIPEANVKPGDANPSVPMVPPNPSTELVGLDLRYVLVPAQGLWLARLYNNGAMRVEDCDFSVQMKDGVHDGREIPTTALIEHIVYSEGNGDFTWRRVWCENAGGHGLYHAYRPWPFAQYLPSNRFFEAPAHFLIEDAYFLDMDQNARRGSFALQLFNPGDVVHPGTVNIDGFVWAAEWPFARDNNRFNYVPFSPGMGKADVEGRRMTCMGALVVHHYDLELHVARAAKLGVPLRQPTDSFRLANFTIWAGFSDFPIGAIRGTREILIEDGAFHAHPEHDQPFLWIDDDAQVAAIAAAELVTVRNVLFTGTAAVRIRKAAPDGGDVTFPQDLVGKVATWRPGMAAPEVAVA